MSGPECRQPRSHCHPTTRGNGKAEMCPIVKGGVRWGGEGGSLGLECC